MRDLPPTPFRRLPGLVLAAAVLLSLSGCESDPLFGDDVRVVKYSPGYLCEAYVYAGKDPAAEAEENFRLGNCRLYAGIGLGAYYPGCAPGVGEKLARRHGTVLLQGTTGGVDIDARDDYQHTVLAYAAAYNAEMVRLVGESGLRRR